MTDALHTARLDIEPVKRSDAEEAWPQVDDDRMWTYFPEQRPATLDDLRSLYERWEHGSSDPSQLWLNWICREHSTRTIAGALQSTVFPHRHTAYIAYAIYPAYQRKGYARESCQAVIEYLRDRRIKRILAEMDVRNEPSYRLAESLGFKRMETHHGVQHGPLTTDEYLYELNV